MKSWKSYFLDFAMVFLAVFLGFWAENFRSQIQEEKKLNRSSWPLSEI